MSDRQSAADILGQDHPLSRLEVAMNVLRRQALVCTSFGLAVGAAAWPHPQRALLLAISAAVVDLVILSAWAALRGERITHVRRLIAGSGQHVLLAEAQRETKRLLSARSRQAQATRLLRILDSAERWDELPAARRPPPAVRGLVQHDVLVRRTAALLVADAATAQGVAMVEQLMANGYQSLLYAGDPERLRREFGRIVYTLEAHALPPR